MELISKLKQRFSVASMLMKIIYINIGVFLVLRIIGLVCVIMGVDPLDVISYVELSSSWTLLLTRPWTMVSYMFAQYEILHIIFNMLWFYWFAVVFLDFFSSRQLCGLYILGGIGGGLLYMVAYTVFPYFAMRQGFLIGSSAAVIAIVTAISCYTPNYKLNLLFLGPVSLKWIAAATIIIDVISITTENGGGHIAHLGGAAVGLWFALAIKQGLDITQIINTALDFLTNIFKKKPKYRKPVFSQRQFHYSASNQAARKNAGNMSAADMETLDTILDKIKKSGYTSLSDEEKKRLFEVSRKK